MRKVEFKSILNLRSFSFLVMLAISMLFVGCEKENDDFVSDDATLKAGKAVMKGESTITEIALDFVGAPEPEFTQLVAALLHVSNNYEDEAGNGIDLVQFFNGTDQYTVFAPTDAAFEALYSTLEVDGISDLDPALVLNVLLYHVTEGRRAANSVVPKNSPRMIETLLDEASFKVDNTGVIWAVGNTATIVQANVSASNGIIHVIDAVILPIEV